MGPCFRVMATGIRRSGRLDDPVWSEETDATNPPGLPSSGETPETHRLLVAVVLAVAFAALSLGFSALISATLVRTYVVPGAGMSPTIEPGTTASVLLSDNTATRESVVVFRAPPELRTIGLAPSTVIKRVVAIGSDTVACCRHGALVLDGRTVSEAYAQGPQPPFGLVRVPVGKVFVLGDNRSDSQDSKVWGPISTDLVVGHVIAQGAAADMLSPTALGAALALFVIFLCWLLGVRRSSAWRGP